MSRMYETRETMTTHNHYPEIYGKGLPRAG